MFEDGNFEDNIDLVVFATGYKVGYPFMVSDILYIFHTSQLLEAAEFR